MTRARSNALAPAAMVVAMAVSCGAAGCSPSAGDPPVAAVIVPPVVLALTPGPPGAATTPAVTIPREAGEVQLRLGGELGEIDHLTAEIAPVAAPDDARRWRVDPAAAAADNATGMVTVPAYALPQGDYVLTLWEGDARVVARYAFQVGPR